MASMAGQVRRLLREAGQATLATALAPDDGGWRDGGGWPYGSLVLACIDEDYSPVLLMSDLAEHVKNLNRDSRAAILFEDAGIRQGAKDPLMLPRVTLLGHVRPVEENGERGRLKGLFLARHPSARVYADFGDFRLYRMSVVKAHLVAGFGEIHWLRAEEFIP